MLNSGADTDMDGCQNDEDPDDDGDGIYDEFDTNSLDASVYTNVDFLTEINSYDSVSLSSVPDNLVFWFAV